VEFDDILHPIFREDELTLILAGAILGGVSGLFQLWANEYFEKKQKEKKESITFESSTEQSNPIKDIHDKPNESTGSNDDFKGITEASESVVISDTEIDAVDHNGSTREQIEINISSDETYVDNTESLEAEESELSK
jgi:hypothetical protein